MTTVQRRRRGPIPETLTEEGPHVRPNVVAYDRTWFVTNDPSRPLESPDQVDVLTDGELGVEPPDGFEGRSPAHEGRRGHIGEAPVGTDEAGLGAEIEW
jgi:hypothetical protein